MKLSKEDIKKISLLARIEIKEEELGKYGKDLSSILDYVEQLQEVETTGADSDMHITPLINSWREDGLNGCTEEERELILENMPDKENGELKTVNVFKK